MTAVRQTIPPEAAPARETKQDIKKHFVKELRQRAAALNLSQSDLARAAGIARDALNKWWHGKLLPNDRSLTKLAQALKCSPTDLIPESFAPEQRKAPPLELRINPHDPSRAHITLDVEVSFATAAKIVELVQADRLF